MASVISRSTLQYFGSVDTPIYPEPEWKSNPDMTQVVDLSHEFWKWDTGTDRPIPQTASEQAATTAAIVEASRDSAILPIDDVETLERAQTSLLVSEFNTHSDKINAILDAVDAATTFAELKTSVAAIANQPTKTLSQFKTDMRDNLGT